LQRVQNNVGRSAFVSVNSACRDMQNGQVTSAVALYRRSRALVGMTGKPLASRWTA
jgi:hypothetical protein